MKSKVFLAGVALAGVAWAAQAEFDYQDPGLTIHVHAAVGEGSFEEGGLRFKGTGKPLVTIDLPVQGMKLSGNIAEGRASPATQEELASMGQAGAPARSQYLLRSADINGSAKVVIDTLTAFNAQVDRAKKQNLPPPQPLTSHDHTELDTGRFQYSGAATQGTVTIPEAFTINTRSTGEKQVKQKDQTVPQTFVQTLVVNGSSGVVGLDPSSKGKTPLRTGTVQGPITFKLVRKVKTAGVDQPDITLNGTADRMEMDLTKPQGTLTATGNVHVEGVNGPIEGSASGDVLTVTLDENLEPISAELKGKPTKTIYKDTKGLGGGGR